MATNYLAVAEQRGLKLKLDNLDLSNWVTDQAKYRKVLSIITKAKSHQKSDGRVYPRYSQHPTTGRIMTRDPNLLQFPYDLVQGDFVKIGPSATEAILFLKENGEDKAADFLIGSQASVSSLMVDHLNFRHGHRQHAKIALFRLMYGQAPETEEQRRCMAALHRLLPGIFGKTLSDAARRKAATLSLEVASYAEQKGKVVGFLHDEILVEGGAQPLSVSDIQDIQDEFYRRLRAWDPEAPPEPVIVELTPLEECLQWLKDCGGVMAIANNPMAHQLIKEGLAKRGGYNHLGQRTLILIES